MNDLHGRVAVVTGAFGSLGCVVARVLAAHGARIVLLDRADASKEVVDEFPSPHLLLSGVQLTDEGRTQDAVATVVERMGRIDMLINVAGGFAWEKIEAGRVATWETMFAVNLKTALVASHAVLPSMLAAGRGGRIVNIGAGAAAKTAGTGMGAYTAAKAGVHKFTESLADELKDRGITVNAILPSIIDTPQNRRDMPDADFSRWVAPLDIANVIAFLVSPQASAVTGATIPVSGRV